jgi:hypothetical protein
LERIAAGDPLAVEGCLEKYRGLVWSIARRFAGNHADAEDAVQEVFIELWQHAGRFNSAMAASDSRNAICLGGRRATTSRHFRAAATDKGTARGVFASGRFPGALYGPGLSSA